MTFFWSTFSFTTWFMSQNNTFNMLLSNETLVLCFSRNPQIEFHSEFRTKFQSKSHISVKIQKKNIVFPSRKQLILPMLKETSFEAIFWMNWMCFRMCLVNNVYWLNVFQNFHIKLQQWAYAQNVLNMKLRQQVIL